MFYAKLSINQHVFPRICHYDSPLIANSHDRHNAFWKISIHGAGIGGVLGFILAIGSAITIPHFSSCTVCNYVILIGLVDICAG